MQRRPSGIAVALVLFTFLLSSSQALADGSASGGTASYGPRAGQGNARVTVTARGKTVAITAFAWTAASGTATWKLVTIDNGQVVDPPQVFQKSSQEPLSEDEAAAIRQRRVPLGKSDLYYCPPTAEDQRVWATAYKRNWWPAPGSVDTPRDLVNNAKQRVTALPFFAPFAVSQVALVPEPGRWVTKTEPREETYWTTERNVAEITMERRTGTMDKYGNERWNNWEYAGTRYEDRGTREVQKTRTYYVNKRVWEGAPETLWIKAANNSAVAAAPTEPPDPDRLINLQGKYDEATGLTTVQVTLDASVTYARAYATIPGSEAAPAQVASTTASASPAGTHAESTAGVPPAAVEPPRPTASAQRTYQPRRRWFGR